MKEWLGFDIPFALLYNEKFNQPIFGSNYLSGSTTPIGTMLPGNSHFKIYFCNGGAGKFLHSFHAILDASRQARKQGSMNVAFNQQLSSGQFMSKNIAYVDPNDPSVVYVVQPEAYAKQDHYMVQHAQTYYGQGNEQQQVYIQPPKVIQPQQQPIYPQVYPQINSNPNPMPYQPMYPQQSQPGYPQPGMQVPNYGNPTMQPSYQPGYHQGQPQPMQVQGNMMMQGGNQQPQLQPQPTPIQFDPNKII